MNKRQRKKQVTRVGQTLRRSMKHFVGRLSSPAIRDEIARVGADFIRAQLRRPSPISMLFEISIKLDPPFKRWADEGNVVHWTAVNTREVAHQSELSMGARYQTKTETRRLRICDYEPVTDDRFVEPDSLVTCVRCQTYDDRMQP